jgi:hypothetical protein
LAVAGCRQARPLLPPQEFRTAVWQWHAPLTSIAKELPVDDAYVRAATLSYDGEHLVPILPQRFEKGEARPVTLVFNFDAGAVRHFEELPVETVRRIVLDTYGAAKEAARKQGLKVQGIQLDLDCPARLLPRYAQLCREVKKGVGQDRLSITGLVSWIDDAKIGELLQALDLFVPQFYEGRLPRRFDDDVPVSDHASYARYRPKLIDLGQPYQVGVAAYGQALLFNAKKDLVGPYRGLSVAEAFRHPSLRLLGIKTVAGERHVRFIADRADAKGRGLGYGILFRVPTAESLAAALDAVRQDPPPNCAGAAIFRLPEAEEASTLPIPTLAAVLKGTAPRAAIMLDSRTRSNPYALIEGNAKETAEDVRVGVRNAGTAPRIEEDPLQIDVRFKSGCAEVVSMAHADRIIPLDANGHPFRGSLARAGGVRFERNVVGVGEAVDLGTIRLGPGCGSEVKLNSTLGKGKP